AVEIRKNFDARQLLEFGPSQRQRRLDQPADFEAPLCAGDLRHAAVMQDGPFSGARLPGRKPVVPARVRADDDTMPDVLWAWWLGRLVFRFHEFMILHPGAAGSLWPQRSLCILLRGTDVANAGGLRHLDQRRKDIDPSAANK